MFLYINCELPDNADCFLTQHHQTLLCSKALWADSWVLTPVRPRGLFMAQCTCVVLTLLTAAPDCSEKHPLLAATVRSGISSAFLCSFPFPAASQWRANRAAMLARSIAGYQTRSVPDLLCTSPTVRCPAARSLQSWAQNRREQGPCAAWTQCGICPWEGTIGWGCNSDRNRGRRGGCKVPLWGCL